jgi:ribosomal protein L12E/L44/L45/RPP1/RPP2
VQASRDSNADDEHDVEGATIAFERSQVDSLIRQVEGHLSQIDEALERSRPARTASASPAACRSRPAASRPAQRAHLRGLRRKVKSQV